MRLDHLLRVQVDTLLQEGDLEVPLVKAEDEVAPLYTYNDSGDGFLFPRPLPRGTHEMCHGGRAAPPAEQCPPRAKGDKEHEFCAKASAALGGDGVREGFLWILQGRHSIDNDAYRLHDDDDDGQIYFIGRCAVKHSCRPQSHGSRSRRLKKGCGWKRRQRP